MARSPHAWGIDIGKCGLKALRCQASPTEPRKLVADAFEYIEYPMMLSQAEADPVELVSSALEELKSRHSFVGARVAIAAPGQAGLTKFIKLPPIEAKKIPDIVKYEANQQIPFPLDQVIWDWQRLATGIEEGGFVMDAEVALFAMKREQVAKAMLPLTTAGIAVDVLQLQPVALANMVMFDQLPAPSTIDPDSPPASIVLVSIGVDSTDIVVTNGLRVWQRSMSIGGSSFTRALVKEMKHTFAKAEQEKRNAVRASDPRAVFKAMRPVFTEFAAELQRSLNYFTGSDKTATIGRVMLLGNAAKLRGLSDFVAKQLQLDVQRLDKFNNLEGAAVLSANAFRENRLAFGTAYGLALQAAGVSDLRTNLIPREIVRDRIIAAKKPWAVAAMLGLLTAAVVNFAGMFLAWQTYAPATYTQAFAAADQTKTRSAAAVSALETVKQKQDESASWQQYLVQVQERRFQSLDLMRAVASLLPRDPDGKVPDDPSDRHEIHVDSLDMQYFPDLATWFARVQGNWAETKAEAGVKPPAAPAAATDGDSAPEATAEGTAAELTAEPTPQGPGWVVQIVGHHFHNREQGNEGEQFLRSRFVHNLLGQGDDVLVSAGEKSGERVPVAELGIGYPVIVMSSPIRKVQLQTVQPPAGGPAVAAGPRDAEQSSGTIELKRYDFILQFVWQPTVPGSKAPPPPPAAESAVP
ncbi:MAG: type IV pilus assembly protein PilM [Planctomycetia bacterium]|nr:type IV pilus assembly protein PilM [Planctomycetia bacterium]